MTASSTIWMALDLLQSPSSIKQLRGAPLPDDVSTLLHIAAGDEEISREAATATRRSTKSIREAAAFYIEQILLHPDADHYRVLGARPEASTAELRRNMALLIRWLHPDQQNGGDRSVFTTRITKAWGELKTDDKRAAYDLSRRRALQKKSTPTKGRSAQYPNASQPSRHRSPPHPRRRSSATVRDPGILMRMLLVLFGRAHH